jgi:hypothetical protein
MITTLIIWGRRDDRHPSLLYNDVVAGGESECCGVSMMIAPIACCIKLAGSRHADRSAPETGHWPSPSQAAKLKPAHRQEQQ